MNMIAQMQSAGNTLAYLCDTAEQQKARAEKYRLIAAMYKASFFHRYGLSEKLQKQVEKDLDAETGEFDGFCYSSKRRDAVFRTLEDMAAEGLLTGEEYGFCSME